MRSNSRWLTGLLVAGCLVVNGLIPRGTTAAPVDVLPGPKSRLPYPSDADVWADASGMPNSTLPALGAGQAGFLNKVGVLVFRPKGDALALDDLAQIYTAQGYLPGGSKPTYAGIYTPPAEALQTGAAANKRETRVYRSRSEGVLLVLTVIRNQRTGHELAGAVLLGGRLDSAQAYSQANSLVDQLAEEARRQRAAGTVSGPTAAPAATKRALPQPPTGFTPAGPSTRIEGMHLRQMLDAIVRDDTVSNRVKEMARMSLSPAGSVNYSTWHSATALADGAFLDYYVQQAGHLGWGQPISRDESQPGRPTLLFQRPRGEGMVMIRAQTVVAAPSGIPSTTIFVLDIEAKSSPPSAK